MILITDLAPLLQLTWQSEGAAEIPTQFPGVPLDATRLGRWFEFWLTQIDQAPARAAFGQQLSVLVDVHCYSRVSHKFQVLEMADQVRRVLGNRLLPVRSAANPEQELGWLRLRETSLRDLTRDSAQESRLPVQHVVVSLAGTVEEEARG